MGHIIPSFISLTDWSKIAYNCYMDDDSSKTDKIDPVAFMDERVPPEFLRKLLQCVTSVYPKADRESAEHDSGQRAYLYGHFRYAYLENALMNINHPGVKVRIRHIRGLFRISQVIINGVLFTASSNLYDDRLPREAHFRKVLALHTTVNSDSPIFNIERQVEEGMEDVELYGIIVHGKDKSDLSSPAFVGIQFPNRPYSKILGYVDLIKRFPVSVETPEVETEIKPEVRIKAKRINE